MAYVLENITPTEQEKIISDAEGHPSDRNSLIHAKDHQEFPSTEHAKRLRIGRTFFSGITNYTNFFAKVGLDITSVLKRRLLRPMRS